MMANLHSILTKDEQQTIDDTLKHRKSPMKINKNKPFGKFRVNLVSLFVNNDVEAILQKLHTHFVIEVIPINIQSKSKHKPFTNFNHPIESLT